MNKCLIRASKLTNNIFVRASFSVILEKIYLHYFNSTRFSVSLNPPSSSLTDNPKYPPQTILANTPRPPLDFQLLSIYDFLETRKLLSKYHASCYFYLIDVGQ
jgi:hypothetical protein